jgi:hypothetical protein
MNFSLFYRKNAFTFAQNYKIIKYVEFEKI